MKLKALTLCAFFAAILTADPKPVSDKALNWRILAKANQAQALQGQIAALQTELQKAQAEAQAAIKEACEAEKIDAAKCSPRVQGDTVFVEEVKAAEQPKK